MDQVKNFIKATVSTIYDTIETEIVLNSGHNLPDPISNNYNLVWWNSTSYPDPADDPNVEIVRVTALLGNTITIIRNQELSGASTKNNVGVNYKMILGPTAKTITDINDKIDTDISTHAILTATHGVSEIADAADFEIGAEVNNISDTDATDLTDGGQSSLHYHDSDRDLDNSTGVLTDGNIPTSIARDIEVATNIGIHAAISDIHHSKIHAAEHVDGTDDIQDATNIVKGLATATHISEIEINTTKNTNATHTGEVIGSDGLIIDSTAISNKGLVTAIGVDQVLIVDATDGELKRSLISDFASVGGDMATTVYDPTAIADDAFDMDNMIEGLAKIFTNTERSKLTSIDISADVNNISDINAVDLTDGNQSSLHYHISDRDLSNVIGTLSKENIDVDIARDSEVVTSIATHAGLSNIHHTEAHLLGSHITDTLANLNTNVIDATLIDTADSRLSDARVPTVHTIESHSSTDATGAELEELTNGSITVLHTHDALAPYVYTPSASGTSTLDLNASSIHDIIMPTGNITIAISNETNGDIFTVKILQDGTGSRTVTWFSTIKWEDGTTPTLTTTADKADTFVFRCTGTDTYDGFTVGLNT